MATYKPTKKGANGRPLPGTRWETQVYLGVDEITGKKKFTSRTFGSRKEGEVWAAKMEGARDDGSYRPTLGRVTFGEYLRDSWLPTYRTQVKGTYNTEKTIGKWILRPQPNTPFLGKVQLTKLTASQFDKLYVAMTEKRGDRRGDQPLQRRAIEHLHGLLKRALKAAVKKGELPRNPAEGATIPKPELRAEVTQEDLEQEGPVRSLSHEQATRFLLAAKQHRWSALWHLLLDAGLRPGEAFALKWAQVDLDAKLVKVRTTLTRTQRDDRKKSWKLTAPKTQRSARDVPISDATITELRRWKKQQAADRLLIGPEWKDFGFVFTTEYGTPLGNNVHRQFARLLREADGGRGDFGTWGPEMKQDAKQRGRPALRPFEPKFVLYVLRHTSATLALLDGVDLLQVSRRLGHTDMAFTARMYGHLKAEHTTQAAESFNRLASGLA